MLLHIIPLEPVCVFVVFRVPLAGGNRKDAADYGDNDQINRLHKGGAIYFVGLSVVACRRSACYSQATGEYGGITHIVDGCEFVDDGYFVDAVVSFEQIGEQEVQPLMGED